MDTLQSIEVVTTGRCNEDIASVSPASDSDSDIDSLFDEPSTLSVPVAIRSAPPIPGLFVPPVLLPLELEAEVAQHCMRMYFDREDVNQIMLFGRTTSDLGDEEDADARMGKGLPLVLIQLLHHLSVILQPWIPDDLHNLLFPPKGAPPRARQAILNLYHPGEGISPHVDLLKRFDDGIIGLSFRSSCVMAFEKVDNPIRDADGCQGGTQDRSRWDLYLPKRSILVLSKDARYNWTHGIPGRAHDLVESEDGRDGPYLVERGTRLSITFRWLLPGADIVGGPEP
ncbi:hypothetical protein HYDPIDRAFT_104465 [Hydnomerulius pinastri MD-312]|nr:hypothetical protein HYDPIDRAFT_104465 [Hydnomerulius pinastri MD-312]